MINFKLKDFVEKNIENFSPENSQDLIKAEKLLKAESKLNGTFSINEIDEFLEYLKNPEQNFDEILKIPAIKDIYSGTEPKNIDKKPDFSKVKSESIENFKEIFTPHLKEFFSQNVRNNQWQTLMYFHKYYQKFISVEAFEFLKSQIHDKNNLIIEGIENHDNLETIRKNHPYCNDRKFYFMQSLFDSFEFDEDILDINNTIARNQHTFINNKIILGEILLALHYFDSPNSRTKKIIEENQDVALGWTKVKSGFFSGIIYQIVRFFNPKTNNKNLVFAIAIILWLIFISILIYFGLNNYKLSISIIVSSLLLAFLGKNTPKGYYGNTEYTDTKEKIIKLTGSSLIIVVQRILWFIFIPSVLIYIYESLCDGKFPPSFFIILGIVGYQFYKNFKNQ